MRQRNPFDDALVLNSLRAAADAYALLHGEPRSAAYRTAWLRFRQRVRTADELRRWEAALAVRERRRRLLAERDAAGTVRGEMPRAERAVAGR